MPDTCDRNARRYASQQHFVRGAWFFHRLAVSCRGANDCLSGVEGIAVGGRGGPVGTLTIAPCHGSPADKAHHRG
ncbi:hypothetical protein GCM10007207_12810 [Asaia siamensis]|uniref:Uncharacterized protein n=1 Tax=Asaia siamensis TaxID=110479 RepID=A0ABQ1LS60_9PROT|nr:hypothetical protein AA0323_0590 [Asaia siamensis NRIC 0323]GGC28769.1 hypothetical protein GCM10007207_12810 [Asaia siamensis]